MHYYRFILHVLLLFFLPLVANAQETKDSTQATDSIQKTIARKGRYLLEIFANRKKIDIDYQKAEEYVTQNAEGYKELMNRFQKDPNSLNEEEAAMLYYGFAFTKDYDPENIDFNINLMKAFKDEDKYSAFMVHKGELLRTPVSLSLLMNTAHLAGEAGDAKSKQKYMQMVTKLLFGIMASGTGYSKENAIKVLYIADEYAIFRDMMGLRKTTQRFIENRYDRMTLETGNGGESIILWFDTYLNHQKLSKKIDKNQKEKEKKKKNKT